MTTKNLLSNTKIASDLLTFKSYFLNFSESNSMRRTHNHNIKTFSKLTDNIIWCLIIFVSLMVLLLNFFNIFDSNIDIFKTIIFSIFQVWIFGFFLVGIITFFSLFNLSKHFLLIIVALTYLLFIIYFVIYTDIVQLLIILTFLFSSQIVYLFFYFFSLFTNLEYNQYKKFNNINSIKLSFAQKINLKSQLNHILKHTDIDNYDLPKKIHHLYLFDINKIVLHHLYNNILENSIVKISIKLHQDPKSFEINLNQILQEEKIDVSALLINISSPEQYSLFFIFNESLSVDVKKQLKQNLSQILQSNTSAKSYLYLIQELKSIRSHKLKERLATKDIKNINPRKKI